MQITISQLRRAVVPFIILLLIIAQHISVPDGKIGPDFWAGVASTGPNLPLYVLLTIVGVWIALMLVVYFVSLIGHKSQRIYPQIYLLTLLIALGAALLLKWSLTPAWLNAVLTAWGLLLAYLSWRRGPTKHGVKA